MTSSGTGMTRAAPAICPRTGNTFLAAECGGFHGDNRLDHVPESIAPSAFRAAEDAMPPSVDRDCVCCFGDSLRIVAAPYAGIQRGDGRHVLIRQDKVENREILGHALRTHGFRDG